MSDRIQVDYRHTTVYYETDLNAVGATTSLTLRTAPVAPAANDAYVRRWGTPYNILDVVAPTTITVRGAGAGSVGRFRFYGATTGTLLYTMTDTVGGALAVVDGAALAAAEPVYCVLDNSGAGTYTVGAASVITLCTDLDPAGLAVQYPREVIVAGAANAVTLYVANGGSTYYEPSLKYGGARHTPVIGSARYSYFMPGLGIAASNACTEIVDSVIYDESANPGVGIAANFRLQSSLGQTPTIQCGVGPRNTRFANAEYNNVTAIYVNKTGSDANAGTWQAPKLTLTAALAAAVAAAKQVVYGGSGATETATFNEALTVAATRTIAADHLLTPTIYYGNVASYPLTLTGGTTYLRGWFVTSAGTGIYENGGIAELYDCKIVATDRCWRVRTAGANVASRTIFTGSYGIYFDNAANAISIYYCEFVSCSVGIAALLALGNSSVTNTIFRTCNQGLYAALAWNVGGTCQYNTFWKCQTGMRFDLGAAVNVVPRDQIISECTTGIYLAALTSLADNFCAVQNNTTPVGGAGAGLYAPANAIAGDPLLVDPAAGWFGIRPDSPCWHADGGNDVGMRRYVFYFSGNSGVIDNLIFDGYDHSWFNGVTTFATRTGCIIKWCTFNDLAGIAIDGYAGAAMTWTVQNTRVEESGCGIMCGHDYFTITESLVVLVRHHGIYVSNMGTTVRHCTIAGAVLGIHHGSSTTHVALAGVDRAMISDSILSNCASFVVDSETGGPATTLVYCCADGNLGTTILLDANCIQVDPLFIDVDTDWHLKGVAGGYPLDSLCIDAASDGYDMGAYLVVRGVTDESWDSYTFAFEGVEVEEALQAKGQEDFETGRGASSLAVKGHKRRYQLSWSTSQGMTEDFREMLELLSTLATSDDQDVTEEKSVLRLHRWPVTPAESYPAVLFDPVYSTAYIAAGTGHRRNAFRGYDLTIQWSDIANGVLDAATATLTSAGAGWVVNEWAGYWIRQSYLDAACAHIVGYNYFRILSNTATVLTLSDPYGRIVTVGAAFACSIESDHKIIGNDDLYYYLEADSRLRAETQPAFIDAIRCRLADTGITVRGQMGWVNDRETNRVPDRLELEEC